MTQSQALSPPVVLNNLTILQELYEQSPNPLLRGYCTSSLGSCITNAWGLDGSPSDAVAYFQLSSDNLLVWYAQYVSRSNSAGLLEFADAIANLAEYVAPATGATESYIWPCTGSSTAVLA